MKVLVVLMMVWVVESTRHLGSFEGSVVRVKGDPVLKKVASRVTEEELQCRSDKTTFGECDSEAERIVKKMVQGVRETFGSCIAAPQVGASKRIILMSLPKERLLEEDEDSVNVVTPPIVLVNPILSGIGDKRIPVWEGCLSVPGTYVVVERFESVKYQAQRLDGAFVEGIATGRLALTMQHEVDHLDGVLMTDIGFSESDTNMSTSEIRSDARGAVTSTEHWDMMDTVPGYDLRTYTLPGSTVTLPSTRHGSGAILKSGL